MKTLMRKWGLALSVLFMAGGMVSCGGSDDDSYQPPVDPTQANPHLEAQGLKCEYASVANGMITMSIKLTNKTGVNLDSLTIGDAPAGSDAHYCMTNTGADYSEKFSLFEPNTGSTQRLKFLTGMTIPKDDSQYITLFINPFSDADADSIIVKLGLKDKNFDFKNQIIDLKVKIKK